MDARSMLRTAGVSLAAALVGAGPAACVERPLLRVAGGPSGAAYQTFTTPNTTSATILWVIDDSASMCEEQFNLRSNIASFIGAFQASWPSGVFHMGVVSTDLSDPAAAGRLRSAPGPIVPSAACPDPPPTLDCAALFPGGLPKWIDDETPDPTAALACLAHVGTAGSGVESALGAALLALSPALLNDPSSNGGFLLPGSLVVVIFVGDEDDCSVCAGESCAPLPGVTSNLDCAIGRAGELTPVEEIVDRFSLLAGPDGKPFVERGFMPVAMIGLDAAGGSAGPVLPDPERPGEVVPICTVEGQGAAAPAPRIEAFVRAFEDAYLIFNLCDDNFGNELATIGGSVGCKLGPRWCLAHPPCPGLTAHDVVVRLETARGELRALVPDIDYVLECAGVYTQPCPGSADEVCADGWRVQLFLTPPPGARVEIVYPVDASDGCVGPFP